MIPSKRWTTLSSRHETPTGNDRPPWRRGTARANETIPPQISGAPANDLRRTPIAVPAGWLALDGLQPAVKTENALALDRPRDYGTEVPPLQEAA